MRLQDRLQNRVLERLIEIHKLNYAMVNFNIHDRKHAIYFLQGAGITSAINARNLRNQVGMLGREWRYISEVAYLTEYFDELADDSREIFAWFKKNGIIVRKPGKGGSDSSKRQLKSGLDQTHFDKYDSLHKKISNELSLFAHASYISTRGNTKRISRAFDYYHSYDDDADSLEALKGVFVSEAISCFLFPSETFPLLKDHYEELSNYKIILNTNYAF